MQIYQFILIIFQISIVITCLSLLFQYSNLFINASIKDDEINSCNEYYNHEISYYSIQKIGVELLRRYHILEITESNQYIGPIKVMKITESSFEKTIHICYQWPLRNKTTLSNLENLLSKIHLSKSEMAYYNTDKHCYQFNNECIYLLPYENCGDARINVNMDNLELALSNVSLLLEYSKVSPYIAKYIADTEKNIAIWFSNLSLKDKSIIYQTVEYTATLLNQYINILEGFKQFNILSSNIESIDDLSEYITEVLDQFNIDLNNLLEEEISDGYQLHDTMINVYNLFTKYYIDILIRCDKYNIYILNKVPDSLLDDNKEVFAILLLKDSINELVNGFIGSMNLLITNLEGHFGENKLYLHWKLHFNSLLSTLDMNNLYTSCSKFQTHDFKVAMDPIEYIPLSQSHSNNKFLTWSFNAPTETIIEEHKLYNIHSANNNDIVLAVITNSDDLSPIKSEIKQAKLNYYLKWSSNFTLNGIKTKKGFSGIFIDDNSVLFTLSEYCEPGYYTFYNASENKYICKECEEGYYCPGDSLKYICDNGPTEDTIYPLKGVKDSNCPFLCEDESKYMHQNECKTIPFGMTYNRTTLEISDCITQLPLSLYHIENECNGQLYQRATVYLNRSANELEDWISNVNIAGNSFIIAARFKLDYINENSMTILKVDLFWTLSIDILKDDQNSYLCRFKFVLKGDVSSNKSDIILYSDIISLEKSNWHHISVHGNYNFRTITMYLNNTELITKWYDISLKPYYTLSRIESSVVIGPPLHTHSELSIDDIVIVKSPINIDDMSPFYTNPIEFIHSGCNLEKNDFIDDTNECLNKCNDGFIRNPENGRCICNDNRCMYDQSTKIQNVCSETQYVVWFGQYVSIKSERDDILITEIHIYDEYGVKLNIHNCYIDSDINDCIILNDGNYAEGLVLNEGMFLRIGLGDQKNISRIHIYADRINDSITDTYLSLFIFNNEMDSVNYDFIVIQDWNIILNDFSSQNKLSSILSPSMTPQAMFNIHNTKCHECENSEIILYNNDAIFCTCKEVEVPCPEFEKVDTDAVIIPPPGIYYNAIEIKPVFLEGYEDNAIVLHILNYESKINVLYNSSYPIVLYESTTVLYYILGNDYYSDIKQVDYKIYGNCPPPKIYPNVTNTFSYPQYIFIVTQDNLKAYYTIDESDPTLMDGLLYEKPFVISTNSNIKAFSHSIDGLCKDSEIVNTNILFNFIDRPSNSPSLRYHVSHFLVLYYVIVKMIIQ